MSRELADEEIRAWMALVRTPGLGASAIRELVADRTSVVEALAQARRAARLDAVAREWLAAPDARLIDGDLRWLQARDHHLLTWTSADYPTLLRSAQNPPAVLFVAGDPTALWMPQIAIVGARSASAAGLANARAFAKAFVDAGNTVTSGLAEGIDGAAHAAALDAGGRTIAVLGTGPDLVYPRQHQALAARIVGHGALVAEFPPGTAGKPEHFPRRNRIIAGLSLGTLVIEAGLNSGSLITARLAAEQGREVFALPGSIHNPLARGSHKLIREGAKLVESAAEVIEELHGVGALLAEGLRRRLGDEEATSAPVAAPADPDYQRLLAALDAQPASLDELALRTQLSAAALSSMLLVLELDGFVIADNGRYARR
jgi:DNA processing protein